MTIFAPEHYLNVIKNLKDIHRLFRFLLGTFLFWIGLFIFQQIIFVIFVANELRNVAFGHTLMGFLYAQRLNFSAASYLMIIPFILSLTGVVIRKPLPCYKISRAFTSVMIVIVLMIGFFDIGLYAVWGTKLNSKALSFLAYHQEIMEMIFNRANLVYFIFFIFISGGIIWLYRKIVKLPEKLCFQGLAPVPFLIIGMGILFVLMRGGFQKYPINKSSCYYSKHSVLNYAALNGFWNLSNLLASSRITENPYRFFESGKAGEIVSNLFQTEKDTTVHIFSIEKPNIIILLMESISADAIGCLGGEKGIMPRFDSIAKQGLLFENFFATGFRTDQGIVAVMSSFPAQPVTSIIKDFGKFEKLPNLITSVDSLDYHTSFYYGGDISYANTSTYLTAAGIDYMAGVDQVPHTRKTDWGAYDEDLFSFFISDSANRREPFLSVMITLTNHEFFNVNVEKVFNRKDKNNGYLNTAYYTDKCIARFLELASHTRWFSNTVFIITSDHAHILPLGRNYNEPARHHIPFLILGQPLKNEFRGQRISKTSSHLDIAPTLLAQLNTPYNRFKYGKNLCNPWTNEFAYYAFDNGFGFITGTSRIIYDHNLAKLIMCDDSASNNNCLEAEKQGKAFIEVVFRNYLDL